MRLEVSAKQKCSITDDLYLKIIDYLLKLSLHAKKISKNIVAIGTFLFL